MGGILKCTVYDPWVPSYKPLTATKLTSQYEWNIDTEHPLKHLELSHDDIQDKGKANSLLKSLAILQITWLVLNMAVRAATGLHVTQLEIATVAFAVVATLTYFASWWKPKDVSEPTRIRHSCHGEWITAPRIVKLSQSTVSPWLAVNPRLSRKSQEKRRIRNDLAWMGAEDLSMVIWLAISSLLFGGLHCIAWNFDFPSQAELVAWRICCAIIATLPGIALAFGTLSIHIKNGLTTWSLKVFTEEFDKLPTMSQDWWERVLHPCFFYLDRNTLETYILSIPAGKMTWSQLLSEVPPGIPINTSGSLQEISSEYASFLGHYQRLRHLWAKAFEDGKLDSEEIQELRWVCSTTAHSWLEVGPNFRGFWQQFEMFVSNSANDPKLGAQDSLGIEKVLQVLGIVSTEIDNRWNEFYQIVYQMPLVVSTTTYVLYPVARLLTILLLFTSLRSLPGDVHQVTPWVNFLPKIS